MAIRPGKYNPLKPDIELFDHKSKKRYGLKIDGSNGLQVGTVSQDDTVHIRTAGKRVGDFDEQRSFKGGRGIENLSTNAAGYWDSNNAWTLTDEHLTSTLLWEMAKGLRSEQIFLPDSTHSLKFQQLFGTTRYVANNWTSAITTFNAAYARMWIRRVGTPGTLTFELRSDSAGNPGAVLKTVTVTVADVTDTVSVFKLFTFSSVQSIVLSTKYHVVLYGASTDNNTNHWEVGVYNTGTTGMSSSDGSSWATSGFDPFYYVADADVARTFHSFVMDDAFYVCSKNDDGTASKLYINGDRGTATSSGSATLTETGKTWTVNGWAGAIVKIVRGAGKGQVRRITSNTATTLTVSVAWTTSLSTNSEYIIYGTNQFTEITGTGLGYVTSVTQANRIVYFAQNGAAARHMIYNATTRAHEFGAQTATPYLWITASGTQGIRVWAISIGSVLSYATAQAYTTTPAALSFSTTTIAIGDTTNLPNSMAEKDGLVYVFKGDGIWNVTDSLTVVKLQTGMEKTPSTYNGTASIVHQQFIYYSWLHSVIRIYGSSHDDIGQDWSGWGLPNGREGIFSSFDSYTSLLIAGVNALSGTSSVLGFDGLGWHELLRAYDSNLKIRMVKIQPCEETRNKLWTDMAGSLVCQNFPYLKGSPRLDTGCRYMHEGVIESAAIDMGTASALPKFIKELTVYCQNLGSGNRIEVDYQVDDDVHTSTWTHATTLYESPESSAFLGLSNIRKFAYRLRIISEDNTNPVDVLGVVPNGYARVPYKMVWTLRCRADNISARGRLVKPDTLMRWLLDNARYPGRLEMLSQYELAHKFFVIVHPPRMFPYKPAQNGQAEESVFTIVLEES